MTRRELQRHIRMVSSMRRARHPGAMPEDNIVWWQQIEQIQADLGVTISWGDWHAANQPAPRQDELPL